MLNRGLSVKKILQKAAGWLVKLKWKLAPQLALTHQQKRRAAMLPENYQWLANEPAPKILIEALNLYGTVELPGAENSPVILGWAKEIGGWIGGWYKQDSVPWCGLFMGVVAKRAGFPFTQDMLGAQKWIHWGNLAPKPMLGDVLVFSRHGGGHVGLYVGQDENCYHVLGGNQSDKVCITRILKTRMLVARRCPWRIKQPENVRVINLKAHGSISTNES